MRHDTTENFSFNHKTVDLYLLHMGSIVVNYLFYAVSHRTTGAADAIIVCPDSIVQ
ncbi:hypothetical protein DPMN_111758 [Dreissena polymorpha]|uniref:Uncharacterized protein n=1 Tax=Dreissena polymorpha TaxID=45954 RepID=A0A9D4QQ92_DREPO|nr:hypothetical protein DPMN_111758 [Dreissena polymorpha]